MNIRNAVLLCLCLLGAVGQVEAQESVATVSQFDLLKASRATDSLRRSASRQQTEVAKLARVASMRADSLARLRQEVTALRAHARTIVVDTVPRVPEVRFVYDTVVRVVHDTVVRIVTAPVTPEQVLFTASKAPATSTPPTAPRAPAAAPAPAPIVNAVKFSGLLQLWLAAGDAGFRNTYRIRRVDLRATGVVTPRISWTVMADLGKTLSASATTSSTGAPQMSVAQSSRVLQDVTISIQQPSWPRLDVGQQKIPFGLEGAQSSGTLEMVERALFASDRARGGSFGDVRDPGAVLRGHWTGALDYDVGVFNGSGESQNDVDANLAKSLIGRVGVRPWPALQLGVSGVYAGTSAGDAPRRDRTGVDVRFKRDRVLLQSEAVSGHDGTLGRRGMYVLASYRAHPALDVHTRFDAWDPDVDREADAASVTERDYAGGVTWKLLTTGFKVQADVVHRTYSSMLSPNRWQLLLNLQTTW